MSICSGVFISLQEARRMAKEKLLKQQTVLIEAAIKGMSEQELSWQLNTEDDPIYWYNIVKHGRDCLSEKGLGHECTCSEEEDEN